MIKKLLLISMLASGSIGFYRAGQSAPLSTDEVSVTTTNHYCDNLGSNEFSDETVQNTLVGNQADIQGSTDSSEEFVGMFIDGYLNTSAHSGNKKIRIKTQDTAVDNYYCNSGSNTIIFIDNNYRYLDNLTVADGENLDQDFIDGELADLSSSVAGYTLDSNFYLGETVFTSATSIEHSIILKTKLVYDDSYRTYQVGVNGPTATVSNTEDGTAGYFTDVKFDKMVTLNSTSDDFSYWKVGDRILSYEKEYSFSVYIDTFVEEVTDGVVSDKQPLINLYHDERNTDMNGLYEIGFSVPSNCEVVETGMLFGGKTFEEAANKVVANSISSNNEYAVKYSGDNKDNHVAYLITKYNDEINIIYDDGFGYEQLLMYGLTGSNGSAISSDSINNLITVSAGEVSTSVGEKVFPDSTKTGSKGMLPKLGSSSGTGSITVNMPTGTQVDKAEVSCLGWGSSEDSISIGGNTTDGINYDNPLFSMITSEFASADSVEITSTSRVLIEAINVYYTSDSESTEAGTTVDTGDTTGDDTGDTTGDTTGDDTPINTGDNPSDVEEKGSTIDPYASISKTSFYSSYSVATSYMDAYYRSLHCLMSGSIADQDQAPTISSNQPMDDTTFKRNITNRYVKTSDGEIIGYRIIDTDGNVVDTIYKGGAYVTLEEVAAYMYAFGEKTANHISSNAKATIASNEWGKYCRGNFAYFACDTVTYPDEPDLPDNYGGTIGDNDKKYYEMDIGTTGTDCDPSYASAVYNDGTTCNRGAARIVFTYNDINDDHIEDPDEKFVFYTYDHYADYQEYLNYSGGWGKMFGVDWGDSEIYPEVSMIEF